MKIFAFTWNIAKKFASRVNWRRLLKVAGAVFLVIALLLLCGHLFLLRKAGQATHEAHQAWTNLGLPLEGLLQSRPPQEDSPAATRLVATVADLGFSLAVQLEPYPIPAPSQEDWGGVEDALKEYLVTELERVEPEACPPPERLSAYLARYSRTFEEVRTQLRSEVPRWRMNWGLGVQGDIPNLLAHFNLARLLTADALAARAAGDPQRGLEDLDALWSLSEGIEEHPELISQLFLLALRRHCVASVRKFDRAPVIWQERLAGWNPLPGLEKACQYESATWELLPHPETVAEIDDPCGCPELAPGEAKWYVVGGVLSLLSQPYFKLCVARAQTIDAGRIKDWRILGPCAMKEAFSAFGDVNKLTPAWNLFARNTLPNAQDAWHRATQYRIQSELAQKVLILKALREETGTWPDKVEGIERSFCSKEHWTYTTSPNGAMSLVYSGQSPYHAAWKGMREPQEYREPGMVIADIK